MTRSTSQQDGENFSNIRFWGASARVEKDPGFFAAGFFVAVAILFLLHVMGKIKLDLKPARSIAMNLADYSSAQANCCLC